MAKKDVKKNNEKKDFFKSFKAELKKVTWPTPKQLVKSTAAVLAIVLVTAAIVFVLDIAFESINKYGINKLKSFVTSSEEGSSEATIENATEDNVVEESSDNASNSDEENNTEVENKDVEDKTSNETENNNSEEQAQQ